MASSSIPPQHNNPRISIVISPVSINTKLESSAGIPNDLNNDFNDKQNPIVFNATTIVLANANRIPIDAPNSGPIDLEIIKYKPPEGIISCYYKNMLTIK